MFYSLAIPRTVALQAPLSMGFPKQEYWSGFPFLSPRDLPNSGIEPVSTALAGRIFTTEQPGQQTLWICYLLWQRLNFPGSASGKEYACQCKRHRLDSWVGKIPCRKKWQTTPVHSCLDNPLDRGACDCGCRQPQAKGYWQQSEQYVHPELRVEHPSP